MPFNNNNEYEPSNKFEIDLKRYLSKYLHTNNCTPKEYKKILNLLSELEEGFYEQDDLLNDDSNLTFEDRRDRRAEARKQYAFPEILSKLRKLQHKRMKYNLNEDNQDWIQCKSKEDEIVKAIWRVWCYEQEHRPRAGIIFLYLDASDSAEVLLTKYRKNDYIAYGFAKGKIEFGETILDCAAREAAEELGLDAKIIYDQIKDSPPIKKNVYNPADKSSIEHYYFIIPVLNKNINFTLNEQEVDGVEWHNVYTLRCCNKCRVKQSVQSVDSLRELNYFMVSCTEQYERNSLVQNILLYLDKMNKNQNASQKYENIHRLCRHN